MVCGDGHCRRRVHSCAHGCLRGQAAAQGDALWVRRLLALLVGRKGGTLKAVPNQKGLSVFHFLDLVAFTSACILQHLDYQQTSVLKVLLKHYGAVPCAQLCLDICWSDLSLWCGAVFCAMHFTERRLSPWWRAESWWSGIVPAVPTAAGLQRQHVSSPLCSCMLLRKTTLWMPPTVPTAVRDTTSLSMPEPASAPRKDSDTKRLLSFPRGPGSNSTLARKCLTARNGRAILHIPS